MALPQSHMLIFTQNLSHNNLIHDSKIYYMSIRFTSGYDRLCRTSYPSHKKILH